MEKKKKHIFLKIIVVLIIIIALIISIPIFIRKYKEDRLWDYQAKTVKVGNVKKLEEKLPEEIKQADYSNDGMTNSEKIERGLSIYSNDTDGDGLRDVDEINKYHSDPLKYSTAGDLYSDAYKVNNNLDVNKKIKEVPNIDIGVSNIKITPKVATDENATYEEYKGKVPNDYRLIVKPFIINSFSGEVRYTLNEDAKNCEVYSYDRLSDKINKNKSKADGNDIIFTNKSGEPVFITYKTSYIKKALKGTLNSNLNYIDIDNVEEEKQYFVVTSAIFNIFLGKPILIYEYTNSPIKIAEASDKTFEKNVNDAIQECLKDMLDNEEYEIAQKLNLLKLNVNHSYIGKMFGKVLGIFAEKVDNSILGLDENTSTEDNNIALGIKNLFFKTYTFTGTRQEMLEKVFGEEINKYMKYDTTDTLNSTISSSPTTEEKKKDETKKRKTRVLADSGFDMEKNSFHFKNVNTKTSPSGLCVGMAYVVANVYNGNYIRTKNDKGEFTYDISDTDKFGCITINNSIGNYKMGTILQSLANADPFDDYYNSKVGNNEVIDANISDEQDKSDIKLIRSLLYHWDYANNELFYKTLGDRLSTTMERDFSQIENLIKYINNNKVAIIGLHKGEGGGGHAINVYKVEQDLEDENIYYLKCYDNNFPLDTYIKQNSKGEFTREKQEMTIKVIRFKHKNKNDTYVYSYDCFKDGRYVYGSAYGDPITLLTSELEKIK